MTEKENTDEAKIELDEPIVIQKEKEISEDAKKAEEFKDLAMRIQAEFDNYRKRNVNAISNARQDGHNDIIEAIFPIMDNFERGLSIIKDENIKSGVELIYKQFLDLLAKYEVEEIEANGTEFNPDLHHAVAQVDDEANANKIIQVYQKGYKRKNKVLRPAMVKVAK